MDSGGPEMVIHTPAGASRSAPTGVKVTMAPNVGTPDTSVSELHGSTDDFWRRRDTGYASFDGNQRATLATPYDFSRSGREAKEVGTRDEVAGEVTTSLDGRSLPGAILGSES